MLTSPLHISRASTADLVSWGANIYVGSGDSGPLPLSILYLRPPWEPARVPYINLGTTGAVCVARCDVYRYIDAGPDFNGEIGVSYRRSLDQRTVRELLSTHRLVLVQYCGGRGRDGIQINWCEWMLSQTAESLALESLAQHLMRSMVVAATQEARSVQVRQSQSNEYHGVQRYLREEYIQAMSAEIAAHRPQSYQLAMLAHFAGMNTKMNNKVPAQDPQATIQVVKPQKLWARKLTL